MDKTLKSKKELAAILKEGNLFKSENDPLGSYTGTGIDPYEVPTQDADDL